MQSGPTIKSMKYSVCPFSNTQQYRLPLYENDARFDNAFLKCTILPTHASAHFLTKTKSDQPSNDGPIGNKSPQKRYTPQTTMTISMDRVSGISRWSVCKNRRPLDSTISNAGTLFAFHIALYFVWSIYFCPKALSELKTR